MADRIEKKELATWGEVLQEVSNRMGEALQRLKLLRDRSLEQGLNRTAEEITTILKLLE